MPAKSTGSIIGYRYYMGMHMTLCRGPVDALLGVMVGDRVLWGTAETTITTVSSPTGSTTTVTQGDYTDNSYLLETSSTSSQVGDTITQVTTGVSFHNTGITATGDYGISKPGLFGGDQREGGIEGTLRVKMGEPTQVTDDYLLKFMGDFTPSFRGVLSIVLPRVYIGVNPYLKNWAFLVRRTPYVNEPGWIGATAKILACDGYYDANPAHIVYECLVSQDFGLGVPTTMIDAASFQAAAEALHAEGFGLSLIWDQQAAVDSFIQEVMNTINGILSVSMVTGLFEIKLIRPDYTVSELPILNESNVIELTSFQRAAWGETVNEVTLSYTHRVSGRATSITVQDLANKQIQGITVTKASSYKGIADANLAYRVAQRDLQTFSTPLSKLKLKVNREAWNLKVGDVFVFQWSRLAIAQTVYRVGNVDYGSLTDGQISIDAVEDVFALPAVSFIPDSPAFLQSVWHEPVGTSVHRMIEANFWDVVHTAGSEFAKNLASTAAYVFGVAGRPIPAALSFQFDTTAVEDYKSTGPFDPEIMGHFTPTCLLPALPAAVESTVTYTQGTDMGLLAEGDWGYVGDEIVMVKSHDSINKTLTLARGVLDTVPYTHTGSQVLFIYNKFRAVQSWEYSAGERIFGLTRTTTSVGTVPVEVAEVMQIDLTSTYARHFRPYPVGNLKFNGLRYPASLSKSQSIGITWASRNRLQQTAYIVEQTAGNITPESGVTYDVIAVVVTNNVEVYRGTVASGLTTLMYILTTSSLASFSVGSTVGIEVKAVRDGVENLMSASWAFTLTA